MRKQWVDLDNLNLESARRAIARARELQPWCTRDRKNQNLYHVTGKQRKHPRHDVEFFFTPAGRFAICRMKNYGGVCLGIAFGTGQGKICFHVARAYFRHKINLARDAQRIERKAAA
jgi:hypothetical protein